MRVSAIVAMSQNRVIGLKNRIPWHLPGDLKFFQRTTLGHHVIMGRKNYQSIGKPLPRRTNIVITRDRSFGSSGCHVVHNLEDALALAYRRKEDEAFVIGGGEIYTLAMPYLHRIYLTTVDLVTEGDVVFPEFELTEWHLIREDLYFADHLNPYNYTIHILDRLTNLP
jgi:dihydrofolate reductase